MDPSYSGQYEQLWRRHWWWQSRHHVVLETLHKLRTQDGPGNKPLLLDIGCGGGWAFDDFSRTAEVYGLEPQRDLAESLPRWRSRIERRAFGPNFVSARRYDIVLMLDVLEHIADDAGAVANLHNLLNPGGRLLLTVPALPMLWSAHDEVNHHVRRYTWKALRRVLTQQGFEVEEMRYLFGWSLGLMLARRWLSRRQRGPYRVHIPPRWINTSMRWLSRFEEFAVRVFGGGPPLGSSLLAIARRPASAGAMQSGATLARAA
jgi:SAM-dependent methyltransferase